MRSLATIFQYIKRYPGLVSLYFFFNILSAIFGLFSLVLLAPFLQVIFKTGSSTIITSRFNIWPLSKLYQWINEQIVTDAGSIKVLGTIVVIVIIVAIAVAFQCEFHATNPKCPRFASLRRRIMHPEIDCVPLRAVNFAGQGRLREQPKQLFA